MQMDVDHANNGGMQNTGNGYKLMKIKVTITARLACPDGKLNTSGPICPNASSVLATGRRLLKYALATATNMMSRNNPSSMLTCSWRSELSLKNHVNAIQNTNHGIPWQDISNAL